MRDVEEDPFAGLAEPSRFQLSGPPQQLEDPTICCHCKATENIEMAPGMTAYYVEPPTRFERALEEPPLDPNRSLPLCPPCLKDYVEHWEEMWRDYYHGC